MALVVNAYSKYIQDKEFDFNKIGLSSYPVPKFTQKYITDLCNLALNDLNQDPVLLHLTGDYVLVGDLHGNIKDLLRILANAGDPLTTRYIFLGDYVDRGQYSIEVITLLLALKQQRPSSIFLLRGNHEFEEVNSIYGFREQVLNDYSHELFRTFNKVFAALPIAAVLNEKMLLVHGGISKHLQNVQQIAAIPKPMARYNGTPYQDLITDLMWSDPSEKYNMYGPSSRGTGFEFGKDALKKFFTTSGMKRIVRAHQCVMNGVQNFCKDKLFTVFSSSNYSEKMANKSGIIKIVDGQVKCFNFKPIDRSQRERTVFKQITAMKMPVEETHTDNGEKKADNAASPKPAARETPKPETRTRRNSLSVKTHFTPRASSNVETMGTSPKQSTKITPPARRPEHRRASLMPGAIPYGYSPAGLQMNSSGSSSSFTGLKANQSSSSSGGFSSPKGGLFSSSSGDFSSPKMKLSPSGSSSGLSPTTSSGPKPPKVPKKF